MKSIIIKKTNVYTTLQEDKRFKQSYTEDVIV